MKKCAKKSMIGVLLLTGLAGCGSRESKPFPNAASIRRLDGSTITSQEIDATVTRLMHDAKVTGLGLALLNDQKVVYLKAYGFRSLNGNLPLNEDSVMSAASFTKVAFAYMVMQLVQDGTLNLDIESSTSTLSPARGLRTPAKELTCCNWSSKRSPTRVSVT